MSLPATNKLILGTVQFGMQYGINNTSGKPGSVEIKSILDTAYRRGIRILDTAEAYGNAQEVIGTYHRNSTNRFEVITKFSSALVLQKTTLSDHIRENLDTLMISSLYGYMFHSFADFEKYYETCREEVLALKRQGLVKRIGVSVYTNSELERLLSFKNIDLVQLPFNVLDNSSQRAEIFDKAKKAGIEIHTRSVFLQGLFFKQPDTLPEQLKPLAPYLEHLRRSASDNALDIESLALQYVLKQNNIDRVLIGVDSVKQLEKNLDAAQFELSAHVQHLIDSIKVKETDLLNPSTWQR